jgi:NhaP-type Na+/H+ and K+/H+ antiporter
MKGKTKTLNKIFTVICTVSAMAILGTVTAFAADPTEPTQIKTLVNLFIKVIKYVGIVVGIWGGVQFALAIKDNDANQKQTGMFTAIGGLLMFSICTAAESGFFGEV